MGRETFQAHLRDIQDRVLALGSMVEGAIRRSTEAMKTFHSQPDFTSLQRTIQDSLVGQPAVEVLTTA